MKKTRVMLLVIFMLMVSVFAFVSQGEELPRETSEKSGTNFYGIKSDIDSIRTEIKLKTSSIPKPSVYIEPDLAILNQEFGVLQYSQSKKVTIYTDSRETIYDNELDERVKIILELTPLDAETAKVVLECADTFKVRPSLILGIMDLESNFGQYLVGTSQDRGYMQIIPGTEKWLATAYGEELGITYNPDNIFEADYNIPLAVKYIQVLRMEYGSNYTKILTSYNRGNYGLQKWYEEHGTYETAYSRVILKREQKYLEVK